MFNNATHVKKASQTLKAVGNFYRIQILLLLVSGEKNVSTINNTVKVSQPALSQHLARLRREGIVKARREAREIFYSLEDVRVLRILGILAEPTTVAA